MLSEKSQSKLIKKKIIEGESAMEEFCGELFEEYFSRETLSLLLLEGELGAGKTTFCRGFMDALGIKENINSPTFNLLNDYQGTKGVLYHYDLYRLSSAAEVQEAGFVDNWVDSAIINGSNSAMGSPSGKGRPVIHAVEWWQRAEELLPLPVSTYLIRLEYDLEDMEQHREVSVYHYE